MYYLYKKKTYCVLLSFMHFFVLLQIWSYDLERRASRALRCGRPIPQHQDYYGLNLNIKSNSNGNFSDDILSWYNELNQYFFSPEDGSCWPSYRMCLGAYTVSAFIL